MFFSQEFVTANKLGLAQNSASVEIKRYQWDHESQRMRILNDLKIRYYEVLGAQEALAVAERLVKIAEKGLAMAERRMEGLHGTRTDLLQAKVQLETVRLTRDEAEHRYLAAWDQLATIVGVSPIQRVPLLGDLTSDIPQLDVDSCLQQLLGNSPQIRSTECDLGHAWSTYREAKAQATPNVTLQTVGEYDKVTQAATISTLVAMPLPIFNRNQGNIDKSSADVIAAQAEVSRVQLVLRDQLADSFRRYKTSLRQSERLRTVILPSAEENLRLTEQVYATGETAFSSVLAAQQTYFQSQVAYVEALTELHKVATEIQGLQLTGGLNPAAIGSAIQNMPGGGAARQRALLNEVQDRAAKQLLPAAQIGR
jgi:cobalt-zinc-cadmium efflux system outer membrane protein